MVFSMATKPRPFVPRAGAPIPQRFPALAWRRPAFLWAPAAFILALGWPAWAVSDDRAMMQFVLIAGVAALLLALLGLGASSLMGKPPRTRRAVMQHIILSSAAIALLAPFFLPGVLASVSAQTGAPAPDFPPSMALSLLPLCFVLGLPMAFVSGFAFSHVALIKPVKGWHEADPDPPRPDPIQTYAAAYDDAVS